MLEHNPELYQKLSTPFSDEESLNRAYALFYEAVKKLRIKYKIPDVVVTCAASHKKGKKGCTLLGSFHFGDSRRVEGLLIEGLRQIWITKSKNILAVLEGNEGD